MVTEKYIQEYLYIDDAEILPEPEKIQHKTDEQDQRGVIVIELF